MQQLMNRVRPGVKQDTVDTGEAEQTDGKVLGQKFVQADHPEILDHADLVLRKVAEEHRGIACTDIREIVVENIVLPEERRRRTVLRALLPDVAARRILDLHQRPERVAVEHELAATGIGRIHTLDQVDDIV